MNGLGALAGLSVSMGLTSVIMYEGPWRALRFHRRVRSALHPQRFHQRLALDVMLRLGTSRAVRIEQRQQQAGIPASAAAHVLRCAVGVVVGVAVAMAGIVVLTQLQQVRKPAALVLLLAVCGLSGWLYVDYRLSQAVREHQQAAAVALPTFVESLALAVTAGAALPRALQLVSQRNTDVLAASLTMTPIELGVDRTLQSLRTSFPIPSVARLVDALTIALERGTPIADVLHAQAHDAREESRRLLLERAGRREVGMLIPVIFFVLPAVVVVALYPGFQELALLAT